MCVCIIIHISRLFILHQALKAIISHELLSFLKGPSVRFLKMLAQSPEEKSQRNPQVMSEANNN